MSAAAMQTAMPSLAQVKRPVLPSKLGAGRRARRRVVRRTRRVRALDSEPQGTTSPTTGTTTKTETAPKTNSATGTSKSASPVATVKTVAGRLLKSMRIVGGAPELILGRCSMIGIPTMAAYEMSKEQQFLQLCSEKKLLLAGLLTFVAVMSLIPIGRGVKDEDFGFMTKEAEFINGRAAMIGFVVLLVLEAKTGGIFF